MPTLRIHTHWQVAQKAFLQAKTCQRVWLPNCLDEKESTGIQQCIRAIAGEVVKSKFVHLINFSGGGQVISLKSATALILDR